MQKRVVPAKIEMLCSHKKAGPPRKERGVSVSKRNRILICLIPPVMVLTGFLLRDVVLFIGSHLPACDFLRATGFYCPGCGNTRSIMALLRFDPITSLGYNIGPMFGGLIAVLGYAELLTWAAGKHRPVVPRSGWFWIACGVLLGLYYIGRNFLPFLTLLPSPFSH